MTYAPPDPRITKIKNNALAACIVGALIGFLWWNTNPAQIIMGDTGSLALGGALGRARRVGVSHGRCAGLR